MHDGSSDTKRFGPVRGFLIDIDGVLYTEKQAIPGALGAIEFLQEKQIPFLLVTNTTRRNRLSLQSNLRRMGFKIPIEQIFSAPVAAVEWLRQHEAESISLFMKGDTYREFKGFRITTNNPEYLVIGDIGEDLTYESINNAFRLVMGGAKMIALHKNRFWRRSIGLAVDTGAVVAALEYASRKRAMVIGKPSKGFFQQAVRMIGVPAEHLAVIGDDLDSDIIGGAQAGLQTIAVSTGKYHDPGSSGRGKRKPDLVWESIADLPGWFTAQSNGTPSQEGNS